MISPKNLVRKTIDLTEYGEITLPASELSFLSEQVFQPVCETLNPLVTVTLGWGGDHLSFKAGSNVGVIQTHGLRVQVRPALSVREMVVLIRYALSGKVPLQHLRSFADVDWGTGFEDVLCMLLCEEAREILRMGLSRRYEERREPLNFLRGRPLWEKNFPWRGGKTPEVTCRYHRLTYDNTDNRLLLAGLRSAVHLANSEEVKRKVFHYLKIIGDLASETVPEPTQFDQAAQRYNRLTEHYRAAHGLCRMLIYSLRPESLYDSGKHLVFGVVLDMAGLFEKFIEQLMADTLKPAGFSIDSQAPDRKALLDAEGYPYISVRPDLIVSQNRIVRGVIDAKYKRYWAAAADGSSPARKIANEDIYQLFFYQQRLQRKFNLPVPPVAVIASPLPEEDERNGPTVAARFRRIIWQAGPEKAGDVRLLLIPMTKFLRFLIQREKPADIMARTGLDRIKELFS
jgi:5-methylcytosine-specific restriction endonuclease McrBC regulatory subunit McrC